MKIIISHDVDHLYPVDHILHDLIIPKLWIRSIFQLLQQRITFNTFLYRLGYPFYKRYHRIEEVLAKDKEYDIPSTFFFGMRRGLGMSYGKKKAEYYVHYVRQCGFDVGVHGIAYQKFNKILNEHNDFKGITNKESFGIRMHYVRKDNNTLGLLAKAGYLFDTTEFDKSGINFTPPYKIKNMWEIPLYIMDGYVMPPGDLEQGKINTVSAIRKAEAEKLPYCTILFHDYQYNELCYPSEKQWYDWLLSYLKHNNYKCISYHEAVKELEVKYGQRHYSLCE